MGHIKVYVKTYIQEELSQCADYNKQQTAWCNRCSGCKRGSNSLLAH